jgi:hypothetical protein
VLEEANVKALSFTFLFILLVSTVLTIAYADSFRCGNEVVLEGETRSMVIAKCGKPHWKEPEKKIQRGALKSSATDVHHRRSAADRGKKVVIEKWFYDCGPDVFVTSLIFEGGRLRKVEPVNQGSGSYKCQPTRHRETAKTGSGDRDTKK